MKNILHKLRKQFYLTKNEKKDLIAERRVQPWNKIKGDKTLRLNYDNLNENSIVFDLGGYEGQFASDIFSKYQSNIFIFEPVLKFYNNILERFIKNDKIKVFNFGLSNKDKEVFFYYSNDGTSEFNKNNERVSVKLKSFENFVSEQNINKIDLLKVNIEGGEYDLFLNLSNDILNKIENIQIQFHDISEESEGRMKTIQNKFSHSHKLEWQYIFVWESWKKVVI